MHDPDFIAAERGRLDLIVRSIEALPDDDPDVPEFWRRARARILNLMGAEEAIYGSAHERTVALLFDCPEMED